MLILKSHLIVWVLLFFLVKLLKFFQQPDFQCMHDEYFVKIRLFNESQIQFPKHNTFLRDFSLFYGSLILLLISQCIFCKILSEMFVLRPLKEKNNYCLLNFPLCTYAFYSTSCSSFKMPDSWILC